MTRRLTLLALVATALTLAPVVSHAACVSVVTVDSAGLNGGGFFVGIYEAQRSTTCSDAPGTVTKDPFERSLYILHNGNVVCWRDDVDPEFDPLLFGAGLHPDRSISCGAEFSASQLESVFRPFQDINPFTSPPTVDAGLEKDVVTEVQGRVWYGGRGYVFPQDSPGIVYRGVRIVPNPST